MTDQIADIRTPAQKAAATRRLNAVHAPEAVASKASNAARKAAATRQANRLAASSPEALAHIGSKLDTFFK